MKGQGFCLDNVLILLDFESGCFKETDRTKKPWKSVFRLAQLEK